MVHPQRAGGLQRKFFFSLLVVGIVPGIAALIATYLYSTASLKEAIGDSFQEIARSTAIRLASAVDNEIDRAIRLALVPVQIKQRVAAANRRYQGRDEAAIRRLLAEDGADVDRRNREQTVQSDETTRYLREWAEQAGYVRVMVADRHGALVASTDPRTHAIQADQPWWQEAMKATAAGSYVSSLILDPQLNDYVFEVAVPVRDDARAAPIGAVGLVIQRDVLTNTILPIHIGDTGHGMLLDTQGTPLICPVLPPTSHLIPEQLLARLTANRPIWLVAEDDAHGGRNAIVGAAPVRFAHLLTPSSLGGDHWYAFVRQAPEETYAPIYALLWTVGGLGLALVVTLASLGFAVGSRIVRPITSLQREAEAIRHGLDSTAAGDDPALPPVPAPQADYRTGDEIEDLARSFRAMRNTLEENLRTIKLQQHELVRREKLASVGQLLAALAHDLRNPLGVIRSSAQLILEKQQENAVKEEVARYIMEEVDKLSHRINDFLRYARQKPPDLRTIAVEEVARSALWQWQAQGGIERLRVETRFGSNLPPVRIDPEQVKEALVNLLTNAREAMPVGGRVMLTTRKGDNGLVEIEVKDTGSGISAMHLPRIFEPFFTTKEYGTGLGLTNVKRLVEDNGGILTVASTEGSGSSFITRFPVAG